MKAKGGERRGKSSGIPVLDRLRQVEGRFTTIEDEEAMNVSEAELDKIDVDMAAPPKPMPRYEDVQLNLPRFPFLAEPGYRSFVGNVAGDAGFDPLGLCKDVKDFVKYREAEIRHGRLSMVAAAAWPLIEYIVQRQNEDVETNDILAEFGERLLPTDILAGAQNSLVEAIILGVITIGSFFEFFRPANRPPGDFQFDIFGLEKWTPPRFMNDLLPPGRPWMAEAEIQHGRIAMVVIIFDIVVEAFTGNPVVEGPEYIFHYIDTKFVSPEYWLSMPDVLESPDGLEGYTDLTSM